MKRLFFLLLFVLLPLPLLADVVIDLRTNQEWEGVILESRSNEKFVYLQLVKGGKRKGILRFPRQHVKIKRTSDYPKLKLTTPSEKEEGNKEKTPLDPAKKDLPKKEINPDSPPSSSKTSDDKSRDKSAKKEESKEEEKKTPLQVEDVPLSQKTNSQPPPPPSRSRNITYLDYLLNRPWYAKLFLGATLVLTIFVIVWKAYPKISG